MFVVSCDLDPSTKLGKARGFLKPDHQFEMSIEEQASALMADGLAMSTDRPQLNVFSTFAAFFEGIAREGLEMWRYHRNLTGANEGLNVTMHMSHVGACTGRDHFSGWSLDWINLAIGYLPYLRGVYAPADARAAFVAVRDLAAHYGGHIMAIPRDNLPILAKQDGSGPLYAADHPYEALTRFRTYPGASRVILAIGAPAFLAAEAAETLAGLGVPTDVIIVNGLPLPAEALAEILDRYSDGIVTIEDGLIGTPGSGLRGFAALVATEGMHRGLPMDFIGIVDPRIAPAEGHLEVWEHFGITAPALVDAVQGLSAG
jgi:transketolase C-terminal domain/subunit